MLNETYRFDDYWSRLGSQDLKRIAAIYRGRPASKQDAIDYLIRALAGPQRVEAYLARLRPFEWTALRILKLLGGETDIASLSLALRTAGAEATGRYRDSYHGSDPVRLALERSGIVIAYWRATGFNDNIPARVLTDSRLLARTASLSCAPLPVRSTPPPTQSLRRRPQAVVMDIVAAARVLNDVGGLGFTQAGTPRANDAKRFARKMGWSDKTEVDGLPFPDPVPAYIGALAGCEILIFEGNRVVGAASLEPLLESGPVEFVRHITVGLLPVTDVPWLQAVFQSWLYAFGPVEVAMVDGRVDQFRLTSLGRALLWSEEMEEPAAQDAAASAAWVVQPNFDVVAFLESASSSQIAFLERHAERVTSGAHAAQYRLTRDSIYGGLEGGTDIESLITRLASGSRAPLPGNVVAELRSWSALREQVTMRQYAELLEFGSAAERQRAIERGVDGTAVGDLFLLLPAGPNRVANTGIVPLIIDYSGSPARCLAASEDGIIRLTADCRDLLTAGYLDVWAERKDATTWTLSRDSVERGCSGRALKDFLAMLTARLQQPLPGLLDVAARAWAGDPVEAGLHQATLLQCQDPDVLESVLKSAALKPFLRGKIGPSTVLVADADVGHVWRVLEWAGIRIQAEIKPHGSRSGAR